MRARPIRAKRSVPSWIPTEPCECLRRPRQPERPLGLDPEISGSCARGHGPGVGSPWPQLDGGLASAQANPWDSARCGHAGALGHSHPRQPGDLLHHLGFDKRSAGV